MKLTNSSKLLFSFFKKNKCIQKLKQTNKTDEIFEDFYHDIKDAYSFLKKSDRKHLFHTKRTNIRSPSQIPKPKNFPESSFPEKVLRHLHETAVADLCYSFSLFNRKINIHFVLEDSDSDSDSNACFDKYVELMIVWLYMVNKYASKECSKEFTVFLYFTSLKKKLPTTNYEALGEEHVNTAFTTTCPVISEIVIFRKEEWFKVFIHETFHNFALDFSDMNNEACHRVIKTIFPVKSEINLFESYTEFWAEIMNVMFCSYHTLNDKNDIDEFLSNTEFFIQYERVFSFFQLIKVLDFMGITYKDLHSNNPTSHFLREKLYREKTSVLSYYVIQLILLNNYQGFLSWCDKHNKNILQFNKHASSQASFCDFIEKNYKTSSMNKCVENTEKLVKKYRGVKNSIIPNYDFLLKNMRMTICELG